MTLERAHGQSLYRSPGHWTEQPEDIPPEVVRVVADEVRRIEREEKQHGNVGA